jgi:predicted amidohydrolase YtcJ
VFFIRRTTVKRAGLLRVLFVVLLTAAVAGISSGTLARSATKIYGAFCVFAPGSAAASAVFPAPCREGNCGNFLARAPRSGQAQTKTGAESKEPAELVLLDGVIYTGDPQRPRVQAMAVSFERVLATGATKDIRAYVGTKTHVIELHGAFVMPGFNDAHTHLASAGDATLTIDLEGASSLAEFQQRIRAHLAEHKPGEWLTGRGWDHTLWPEKRFPSRQDLDAISTAHPMFFGRIDGHVAVANSRALEIAGITRATKDPPGGSIERDAAGEPTGMLKEDAAMSVVESHIPSVTPQQHRRGIEMALEDAARHGVTTLQDNSNFTDFLVYEEIRKDGRLSARITEWLPFQLPIEKLEELRKRGGTADLVLRTGALKLVADGSLGSRTAALLAPYADEPSSAGIMTIEPEQLKKMVLERDKAGFQIAIHAIGDRTNRVVLDAFAAARDANGARDSRHRIEHAQVIATQDIPRFAQLGVIASMQPSHETTDMRWAAARLGPERSRGAYAWNSLLKSGARLAFGTDYPVEPIDPMRGLYACVTRARPEGGGAWQPQERISIDECIAAYTQGSAYAEFSEKEKGQLVTGQLADVIILSGDPTKSKPAKLLQIHVLKTFLGGRQVWPK